MRSRKKSPKLLKSFGSQGFSVLLYRRNHRLYVRWWDGEHWKWRSLGHGDVDRGEEEAKQLAADRLTADRALGDGTITLTDLLARYEQKVTAHKPDAQPAEDRRRMDLWEAFFGTVEVHTITHAEIARFVRERYAGKIHVPYRALRAKVTDNTIGADIIFLNSVFNWGVQAKILRENPIKGCARPKTANPKRPLTTWDRHLKLVAVADEVDPQGRFERFLWLSESLGWRLTAICELRAEDVDRGRGADYPHGRIRKRGEVDKERVDMWVPLSADARNAIDRLPVVGGWLFPSPKDSEQPWSRWHARDLYDRAEQLAGLKPLDGGDFHAYRRKWATERKHLPPQDVAAAGGWKDLRSLQNAYQQVDSQTLLAVVTEPTKLREARGQTGTQ